MILAEGDFYAGIGSRETPAPVLSKMYALGTLCSYLGLILRSGGAKGADTAFERAVEEDDGLMEIYKYTDASPEAIELASQYHPAWHRCNPGARRLHGRNMMIMLGENLNHPVKFVVCWTHDGKASGGTGQALRYAERNTIPIYNLYDPSEGHRLVDDLQECFGTEKFGHEFFHIRELL